MKKIKQIKVEDHFKNYKVLELSKIKPTDENYKEDNEWMQGQLENNFEIDHDEFKYEVVNGNHRYFALKNKGSKKVIAYNLGKISAEEAEKIAIVTNETKFKADPIKLAKKLKELMKAMSSEELAFDMPYKPEEMSNMVAMLDFNWEDAAKPTSETTPENVNSGSDPDEFKEVKFRLPAQIAEQFEEQINRFKKALYPNEELSNVSLVIPIEAMIQHLAQIPDENLV